MMKDRTYFPELDGLRFFAFLLVFIHHAPQIGEHPFWATLLQYGWMGVDLFLCLSAFLFAKLLYVEYQQTGSIKISHFYIRRSLRIWPLYYAFSFVTIVATYYIVNSYDLQRMFGILTFTDNIMSAVFYVYNPFLYAGHLWTIAYEEQFYAVIPWALRYMFKLSLKARTLILLFFVGLGFVVRASYIWFQIPHPAIWVLPIAHFDSILMGLALGLGILDPILSKIQKPVIALIGVALLVVVCHLPNVSVVSWYLMLTYPLVGIGMGMLIYAVMHLGNSQWLRWLTSKPLRYLGKISYGLYVYHIFSLEYFGKFFTVDRVNYWLWFLGALVLPLFFTILISSLSYNFLEKPFLKLKDRFSVVMSRPV